jgi:hypothetical protein
MPEPSQSGSTNQIQSDPGSASANGRGPQDRASNENRPAGEPSGDEASVTTDTEIRNPPKIGLKDLHGSQITTIFSCTRQFVIYEADNQVRFMLPEDYNTAKALRQRIADLGGLRASIEDLRNHPSLNSTNESMRSAREITWALAQAFEDESNPPSERPKEILTRVDARLRNLVKSHYRKKYVLANLIAFGAIEFLLLAMAIVFGHFITLPGNMAALHHYALYAAFGGLGAFLSVITGIRSLDVDITLKKWEHVFAGANRIMIGVIGAVVVSLALDSNFIDPTFGNSTAEKGEGMSGLKRQVALSLIFAFIGGFSESIVPNLLRRGEQATGGSDRQNTPSDPIVKDMKP